jgi:predicted nucleic acid-binding protein
MSSTVCVDASLIVRILLPAPHSDRALTQLESWQQQETQLTAPALLAFQVCSVLRRSVYLRAITPAQGEKSFAQFWRLPIHLSSRRALFPLAWRLAAELERPRTYDTTYLALARLLQCELWTADQKFYNAVKGKAAEVRWIGEDANPPGR